MNVLLIEDSRFLRAAIERALSKTGHAVTASVLREYDGVGRYGGEEFLLVLPGCDLETTIKRANVIRPSISSKPTETLLGETIVTASMGAAVTDLKESGETSLRIVDAALYQAKRNGRNRVEQAPAATIASAG